MLTSTSGLAADAWTDRVHLHLDRRLTCFSPSSPAPSSASPISLSLQFVALGGVGDVTAPSTSQVDDGRSEAAPGSASEVFDVADHLAITRRAVAEHAHRGRQRRRHADAGAVRVTTPHGTLMLHPLRLPTLRLWELSGDYHQAKVDHEECTNLPTVLPQTSLTIFLFRNIFNSKRNLRIKNYYTKNRHPCIYSDE